LPQCRSDASQKLLDSNRAADPSITLGIYSHVIGDAQRRAVEKVAGILDYFGLQTEPETELIQ